MKILPLLFRDLVTVRVPTGTFFLASLIGPEFENNRAMGFGTTKRSGALLTGRKRRRKVGGLTPQGLFLPCVDWSCCRVPAGAGAADRR